MLDAATPTIELLISASANDVGWSGTMCPRFHNVRGPEVPIREPLSRADREEIRWHLEDFLFLPLGGNAVRAANAQDQQGKYGKELGRQLAKSDIVLDWYAAVRNCGRGHMELIATTAASGVALSSWWELLQLDDSGPVWQSCVAIGRRTSLIAIDDADPAQRREPLRVLLVVARPDDAPFLDTRHTPSALLDTTAKVRGVSIEFCRPPTFENFASLVQSAKNNGSPFQIVHFEGHGAIDSHGKGYLLFESHSGDGTRIYSEAFSEVVSDGHVGLVLLEACRTAASTHHSSSLAQQLVRAGIPQVIGMAAAAHIDMTRLLVVALFRLLLCGETVDEAMSRARAVVAEERWRRTPSGTAVELDDWFIPHLYRSCSPRAIASPMNYGTSHTAPLQPADATWSCNLQGRGHEIHQIERALATSPIVYLHGFCGIGKTALARDAAEWLRRSGMFDRCLHVDGPSSRALDTVLASLRQALSSEVGGHISSEAELIEHLQRGRYLIVWDDFVVDSTDTASQRQATRDSLMSWTAGSSRALVVTRHGQVPFSAASILIHELLPADAAALWRADRSREVVSKVLWASYGVPLLLLGADVPQLAQRLESSISALSPDARRRLPLAGLLVGGVHESQVESLTGENPTVDPSWTEFRSLGLLRNEGSMLLFDPVLRYVVDKANAEVLTKFVDVIALSANALRMVYDGEAGDRSIATMDATERMMRRGIEVALELGLTAEASSIFGMLARFYTSQERTSDIAALHSEFHASSRNQSDLADPDVGVLVSGRLLHEAVQLSATDPRTAQTQLTDLVCRLESVNSRDTRLEVALTVAHLARVQSQAGAASEALEALERAEGLLRSLPAHFTQARSTLRSVVGERVNVLRSLSRLHEALMKSAEHEQMCREQGAELALTSALGARADVLMALGQPAEAFKTLCEVEARVHRDGDFTNLGPILHSMAVALTSMGRLDEAEKHLRRALDSFRGSDHLAGQSLVMNALGILATQRGRNREAVTWFKQGIAIAPLAVSRASAMNWFNLGTCLIADSRQAADPVNRRATSLDATNALSKAREIAMELNLPKERADAEHNLAVVLADAGDMARARNLLASAAEIRRRIRDPNFKQSAEALAAISKKLGF